MEAFSDCTLGDRVSVCNIREPWFDVIDQSTEEGKVLSKILKYKTKRENNLYVDDIGVTESSVDMGHLLWDKKKPVHKMPTKDIEILVVPLTTGDPSEDVLTAEMVGKLIPRNNEAALRHLEYELRMGKLVNQLFPANTPRVCYTGIRAVEKDWFGLKKKGNKQLANFHKHGGYMWVQQKCDKFKSVYDDISADAAALQLFEIMKKFVQGGCMHNDLHSGNVMSLYKKPIIIDFDLSRFVPPVLSPSGIELVTHAQMWSLCDSTNDNNKPTTDLTEAVSQLLLSRMFRYQSKKEQARVKSPKEPASGFTEHFMKALGSARGATKNEYQNLKDYMTLMFFLPWINQKVQTADDEATACGDWIYLIRNLDPTKGYASQNKTVKDCMSSRGVNEPDGGVYLCTHVLEYFETNGPSPQSP